MKRGLSRHHPSLEEGGWLYSVEVEGAGESACGDELSGWTRRHASVVGSCNSRKLKDNRAEVIPTHPPLLLLALLRTPLQPDNAHPLSFTLVFHVTAKRWWLPTRRKRGTDGRGEEKDGSCFKLVTPVGKSASSGAGLTPSLATCRDLAFTQ